MVNSLHFRYQFMIKMLISAKIYRVILQWPNFPQKPTMVCDNIARLATSICQLTRYRAGQTPIEDRARQLLPGLASIKLIKRAA